MIIRMGSFMPINIACLAERPIIEHIPPERMGVSVQITERSARSMHAINFNVDKARYDSEQTPQHLILEIY